MEEGVSINSLCETWPLWQRRIIAYSNLEKTHRLKVRQLLHHLDSNEPFDEGKVIERAITPCVNYVNYSIIGLIGLQLLSEFLIPKAYKERLVNVAKVNYIGTACVRTLG